MGRRIKDELGTSGSTGREVMARTLFADAQVCLCDKSMTCLGCLRNRNKVEAVSSLMM
jgi:hypothetical protein